MHNNEMLCCQEMPDDKLIQQVMPLWYATQVWSKELLVRAFSLEKPEDILRPEFRGLVTIPGTNWCVRTHGIGVDIYKTPEVGGIDFDFNKPDPDEWRLKIFFMKQFNDGQLPYSEYMHLVDDEELLDRAIATVI